MAGVACLNKSSPKGAIGVALKLPVAIVLYSATRCFMVSWMVKRIFGTPACHLLALSVRERYGLRTHLFASHGFNSSRTAGKRVKHHSLLIGDYG
jgi:hypothetical protein